MGSQVFYRKWRPQRFTDVVGQEYVTQTLLNALATGRTAHAYLFCGPRGTGKTSTGRILAKALNCSRNGKGEPCNECPICVAITEGRALDLIEIDAASNTGVDDVRSLRDKVNFSPGEGRYKVYIIDEVHMLSNSAFNALLKTLEEPPPHSIFVLATTETEKVPATVISRCQRFDFRRISLDDVVNRLALLCKDEQIQATPEVLRAVARSAGGSLRDAENIFEQIVVGYGRDLQMEQLRDFLGIAGDRQVRELASAALRGDISAGLKTLASAVNEGLDLRQLHRQLMEHLRSLLLIKAGAGDTIDVPAELRQEMQAAAASISLEQLLRAVKLFGQVDMRASYSTLPLELALVDAATMPERAMEPRAGERAVVQPARAAQPQAAPASGISRPSSQPSPAPPAGPGADGAGRVAPPRAAAGPAPVEQGDAHRPGAPPSVGGVAPPARAPLTQPAASKPADAAGKAPSAPPRASAQASAASSDTAAPHPAGAAGEGSPDLLGQIKANWKDIIEASKKKGQRLKIDAFLRSGEPLAVEADAVVLGFATQYVVDKMRQELENPATRRALEEAFSGILGDRRPIRCIVKPAQKKSGDHLIKAAMQMGARVMETEDNR